MSLVLKCFNYKLLVSLVLILHAFSAIAADDNVETLDEVSIVGNSELPALDFNLSWRLPSVESRKDHSLPKDIGKVLSPLEPKRHQQLIHFSRFLEVDTPRYKAQ